MALDTRAQASRILGSFNRSEIASIVKTLACGLLALAVVWMPEVLGLGWYAELDAAGRAALGIMVFAAALWVSEAMPAFAVALLVIGLQIAILGRPGGVFAAEDDTSAWLMFVSPWASGIMWLFLGGFVLAHSCSKTGLDRWLAGIFLGRVVGRPALLVLGVMGVTFVFSMFMSNTATAAMMMAVTAPVVAGLPKHSKLARGLVVSVAVAANLGGIGTIIGTPPNAIAAGQLPEGFRLNFLQWMGVALPPALILAAIAYGLIWRIWIRGESSAGASLDAVPDGDPRRLRQRVIVMAVFTLTVGLWMGGSAFGIPSAVVSFIPIVVLAISGVMTSSDVRELPWDVLLLLAGGLSLGVGVKETGLAEWLAGRVPTTLPPIGIAFVFAAVGLVLSNLMSNTAAAALLIPLGGSLVGPENARLVIVAVAMGCSAAMCLPISTPPNAIVYSSGRLTVRDFMIPGLLLGALVPFVVFWLKAVV
jgi:sodium-dependent dicarboxylate transporter 2/3/5